METVDCIVVGAGVVGLAVARRLARAGRDVVVLEAADAIGTETSSRNSEVIHAGIYYVPGSLKAQLCVQGRHQLYDYCASHGVSHRRCGKLIVATTADQHAGLEKVMARARASGVDDLQWLSAAEAAALEPQLRCTEALLSPSTGIVDSHGYMLALRGEAESHGAMIAFKSPLAAARVVAGGFELDVGGEADSRIRCTTLVNSAGLQAPHVAARIEGLDARHVPTPHLCKGSYFSLTGRAPFSRLVYPVPDEAGLGVHLTLDLAGQARFGPDTEWVDHVDYRVDPRRCDGFYDVIRRYWPGLRDGTLAPAYSGMRPKIVGPDAPAADFVISGPVDHGVAGLVNLFGIESPGLTASLAVADRVHAALNDG